mgnify:CR=1 FL=1
MEPVFIKINDDIFNVNKIQSIGYEDQKNCLGNDSGVYMLHIYMENDIGTQHKAYTTMIKSDKDSRLKFALRYLANDEEISELYELIKTGKAPGAGKQSGT